MRFLRQSLTGLLLISLTLGLLAYAGHTVLSAIDDRMTRDEQVPQNRERVFAVNVITARETTQTPLLTAFGEVQSRRTLEIRAKSSGTLVELADNFVEGGRVRAGELLARVDPADAQFALDRAESELMDARAEQSEAIRSLTLAQDELTAAREQAELRARAFTRQKDLEDRGVGTAAAVETAELAASQARQAVLTGRQALAAAEARVDQARTRLARAKIALEEAKLNLEDTRITAGFAGTLADVSVVQGGLVSVNEQLARLVDGGMLEIAFRVSTQQYARLLDASGALIGAPVTAVLDVFGLRIEAKGTLSRDGATVGEGQSGRLLFARLDDARGMKPGDFVTVHIEEPPLGGVIRLPATALDADRDVLVLTGDQRLEEIGVELLRRQGDDVLVAGGALTGREVVAQRTPLLGTGIKVRPLRVSPEAKTGQAGFLELSEDRRARLRAFVEASAELSAEVKSRLLAQLDKPRVPARMVERLERRMGG